MTQTLSDRLKDVQRQYVEMEQHLASIQTATEALRATCDVLTKARPVFERAIAAAARMDQREQTMIAIEDRLRRSMVELIDRIGDPDGIPDEPSSRKETTG